MISPARNTSATLRTAFTRRSNMPTIDVTGKRRSDRASCWTSGSWECPGTGGYRLTVIAVTVQIGLRENRQTGALARRPSHLLSDGRRDGPGIVEDRRPLERGHSHDATLGIALQRVSFTASIPVAHRVADVRSFQ